MKFLLRTIFLNKIKAQIRKPSQINHWRDFSFPPQNTLAALYREDTELPFEEKRKECQQLATQEATVSQYFRYSMDSIVIGFVKTYKQPWNIASNSTTLACHKVTFICLSEIIKVVMFCFMLSKGTEKLGFYLWYRPRILVKTSNYIMLCMLPSNGANLLLF